MAIYDDKKLYWMKLTDRLMTSDTVDFLMSQQDGANYIVLYQMLCLKSINNNGELVRKLGEVTIPYDEVKIQRDCKWFSIDTVRVGLELFKKLGLVYVNNKGVLQITDFDRLIGCQTVGAEKKQIQLQRRQNALSYSVDSYDTIFDEFGCKGAYRDALFELIKYNLMKGIKVTNDRLQTMIVRLDRLYADDNDKARYVTNEIIKGHNYLECEIIERN